ncbi:MAG: PEP-CTERM sorting domain-containing protein [Methylococcales bacterium]|nr:PEP-CTERM sorting domain-containing protein [Methylococcales bacterium]
MKNRTISTICAAVVLACIASHTHAANILVSGNSMSQSNTNLTGAIAGLGHTAAFVAPANFAGTSLAGFDAVWLDGFSLYGMGSWSADLLTFMNNGGNVFVQNPGFGSESLSQYPLGAQLSANFTYPPGENLISIVDTISPLGANHAVNAGLTNAGLSQWALASAFGYFSNIGAFSGLTSTGTAGEWVTIATKVGAGHLVYTQQGVSQYLSNPGPSSDAARFLDNVVTLTTSVPEPSSMTLLLLSFGLIGFISLRNKAHTKVTGGEA